MADAISLQLNIENSLVATLKETQTMMKGFNSLLEKSSKGFQAIDKSAGKLVDHYDDIEQSQTKITKSTTVWGTGLQKAVGFTKQLASGFKGIVLAGGLLGLIKQTLNLNDAMKDLSYRMGEAGKTSGVLTDAVHGVTQATGIATDKAMGLIIQLRELRVPTSLIEEMATNTARFSEITGVTADGAGRLAGDLMRVGRLGVDATTNIMAGMIQVQRGIGMSSSQMQELTEGIIESTKMLNLMGKSAGQIESFNKGVTKLAAAFTQVGMEAADATKFIEALLDPGRVEDNALLYAKLGISMEEAFAGDIDPGMLASKFKDLGMEMQNMAGPAAAAFAKEMGYSVGQLRQFGEMDLSELEGIFSGGADAAGEMAAQQDEQLSAQDRLEKMTNRFRDSLVSMGEMLLPIIDKLAIWGEKLSKLFGSLGNMGKIAILALLVGFKMLIGTIRKRFFSVATDTKQAITTAIIEGMDQGSRKGAMMMQKNISARAVDRQARVQQGPAFGAMQERAQEFDVMAAGNLTASVKRMTEGTADYVRNISAGAKPLSRIGVLTQQNNKVIADRLGFIRQEHGAISGMLSVRKQMAEQSKDDINNRINYLKTVKKVAENDWELVKLTKERGKLDKVIGNAKSENAKELLRLNQRQDRALKRMSEEQLRSIMKQKEDEITRFKSQRRNSDANIKNLEASQQLIKENKLLHADDHLILKQLREEEDRINIELAQQNSIREQSNKELLQMRASQKALESTVGRVDTRPGAEARRLSIWRKTGKFLGSSLNKAAQKIDDAWDKAKNSAKQIVKNMAERLKPSNILAAVRKRFSAEGREEAKQARAAKSGVGGALGKIGKLLGPIMLIGSMLMRLEPIQKAVQGVMEKMRPIIQKLGEKLAPIFEKLANALMPIVTVLINSLMPVFDILAEVMGNIFEKIGPLLGNLVKLLLPPLVFVLGLLLQIIGTAIKAIGNLGKFMMELPARIGSFIAFPFNRERRERETAERIQEMQNSRIAGAVYAVYDGIAETGDSLIGAGRELTQTQISFDDSLDAMPAAVADGVAQGMTESVTTWTPAMLRSAESGIKVESHATRSESGSLIQGIQEAVVTGTALGAAAASGGMEVDSEGNITSNNPGVTMLLNRLVQVEEEILTETQESNRVRGDHYLSTFRTVD